MSKRSRYTKIPQLDVAWSACIKIKMNNVDSYDKEAQERISYDEKNIDKKRSYLNLFVHGFDEENEIIIDDTKYEDSLKDRIIKRINDAGAKIIFDKKEVKRAKTKSAYYTDNGHNTKESVIAEGIIFQFSHELAMKMLEEDGMLDENGKIREGAELPKDGKMYKWIADTYKFACDKWGTENVVGAYLHMDEYTPHLHIFVVPLTLRKCKYRGKPIMNDDGKQKIKGVLNAKNIFSPRTIKQLWPDYAMAMKKYGATAAKGLIPKDQYDNVASLTRMAQNLQVSIDKLEEKESKAYNDYLSAEVDVMLMQEKELQAHNDCQMIEADIALSKLELADVKEDIEKYKKAKREHIENLGRLFATLKGTGFKKYMDELPWRIMEGIRLILDVKGLYKGYSVDDVGLFNGKIAIKLTSPDAELLILKIYPDGKTYLNEMLVKGRDGTPVDLSDISGMFGQINPEVRMIFDSIFLKSGNILAQMASQQTRRSNVDASKNKGEIEYGGEKKKYSIKI